MKKILPYLFMSMALVACGDKSNKESVSNTQVKSEMTKDSLSQYLANVQLLDVADTIKEINETIQNHYTWMDAIKACPDGYRIPTVEEFQKLASRISEFTRGDVWWTANVKEDPNDPTAAGVVMAFLPEGGFKFQFKNTSITDIAKVKCLQDSSQNKTIVNENPQIISEFEGSITEVKLTPYYETSLDNMGCTDCCCGEGNGGVLDVTIQVDSSRTETFQIKELNDTFCGALSFNENNTPKDIQKASDGCTPAAMENFKILQLFQPGVKVKRNACLSSLYVLSSSKNSKEEVSCGETITLEFSGKVQDIALAQNDDPEAEKECNYSLLLSGSTKAISTKGTCSNAEPGNDYNIQVTVTMDAVTAKDQNPIMEMEYPCCYGEIQSHQISDISFTAINP